MVIDMISVFFIDDVDDRKTRAGWYGLGFFGLGCAMFLANFAQVTPLCHTYHTIHYFMFAVYVCA